VATVKALLRNKLTSRAAFGGDLTEGQLLPPRALTSRHRRPTCTSLARAIQSASIAGGLHPRHPRFLGQAAGSGVGQASCSW
jgi:hypothetical protein